MHRYDVISAAVKPHCDNKNKESGLNPCYRDIVWKKCRERKEGERERENVNCTTALENRPTWDIFIATATSCHISIGWIVDAGHSSCHLPNAHLIYLTLSEFYLRLSSVTRPRQQPFLNLTGLTVQHKTTVVEPGPKTSLYFSHTGQHLRRPNFAAIKWGEKNIVQDDNSTELKLYVLMLNQKQQIIFFAWFRKPRGFKSNKLKLVRLSKCQMLLNLSNLQHRLTFLLYFLLQISFQSSKCEKSKYTSTSVQSASAKLYRQLLAWHPQA